MRKYRQLMKKCISLAKKSEGHTSPNPLVGAIIFDDDFNIISMGRHEYYGGYHAERNAILNTKVDLKGKNIIVNLEPCSHYGKTPPCADFIIEKGFKKVICGMVDPNEKVAGRGIEKLKKAGIEVITGVLEEECKELNKFFIKNQTKKMPYITIKTATTLDGKIATSENVSKWITGEVARREVQNLRNKYDAILTGSNTVIVDNPSLTCRKRNGRNPIRVILDTHLSTSYEHNVYKNDGTKVILVTSKNTNIEDFNRHVPYVEILKCEEKNNHIDLNDAIKKLYNLGIMSILVEAGGRVNKSFVEEELADDLIQFIAPKILGDSSGQGFVNGFTRKGLTDCNILEITSTKRLKNDIMVIGKFKY